jgi:uncharacterized protein (TIGR02246 family)
MMHHPTAVVAAALALLVFPRSDSGAQAAQAGVEAAVARMIDAANRVDLEGVVAQWAPDVEILDGGTRYPDAAAVRRVFGPGFASLKGQDIRVQQSRVRMITPTTALYTGSGTFTATDLEGVTSPRRPFNWTILWENRGGTWKAVSLHQSFDPVPAGVAQAGQPTAGDIQAFRDLVAQHAAAINARDAAAVAATFASTADQVFIDQPMLGNRDAIRAASQQSLGGLPASMRFTLTMTGARMIAPGVALVETDATFSEGPMRGNRGTMVVVREDGRWLISALRVYPAVATPTTRPGPP